MKNTNTQTKGQKVMFQMNGRNQIGEITTATESTQTVLCKDRSGYWWTVDMHHTQLTPVYATGDGRFVTVPEND